MSDSLIFLTVLACIIATVLICILIHEYLIRDYINNPPVTLTLCNYQVQVYQNEELIYTGLHLGWDAEDACARCREHLENLDKLNKPPFVYKFLTHAKT